jgi:hypothetical protein
MKRDFRMSQLLSAIEETLAPINMIHSPFLCSRLTPSTGIQVSDLASSPPLLRMKASETEILECCSRSRQLDVVATQLISPHFEVRTQTIILRNASLLGSAFEIRDFISRLQGNLEFRLFPTNDGNDIAIHFNCVEQCIAIWRVLELVPFRGQMLDVEAYAPSAAELPRPEVKTTITLPIVEFPSKRMPTIAVTFGRNSRYGDVRI